MLQIAFHRFSNVLSSHIFQAHKLLEGRSGKISSVTLYGCGSPGSNNDWWRLGFNRVTVYKSSVGSQEKMEFCLVEFQENYGHNEHQNGMSIHASKNGNCGHKDSKHGDLSGQTLLLASTITTGPSDWLKWIWFLHCFPPHCFLALVIFSGHQLH